MAGKRTGGLPKGNGEPTKIIPRPNYGLVEVEEWRPIPGLQFYEASSFGRIRSLDQTICHKGPWGKIAVRRINGRVLKCKPKPNGSGAVYWQFHAGHGDHRMVSRCVCAAFHGPALSWRHEAAHLDGNPANNRPRNLAWATPLQNAMHKHAHGTVARGIKNAAAKITEIDVHRIFEAYCFGVDMGSIAVLYNVTPSSIGNILRGDTWHHVDVGVFRDAAARRAKLNLEKSQVAGAMRWKFA